MKVFVLAGAMAVLFCQLASGFMIAPSAFAGSSVVRTKQPSAADRRSHN